MRRVLLISFLCFLAIVMCGCKKAQLRRQMKELMSSTIVLPKKISCVYNGKIYPMPDSLRNKPKLIIYIGSTECTTCRISHLESYHDLFHLSRDTGLFEVVVLLSNIELYGVPVLRYVSDQKLEHPVFIDIENQFLALNPSIPKGEKRLHVLLTNNTGAPICVGDPAGSKKKLEVFMEALYFITQ